MLFSAFLAWSSHTKLFLVLLPVLMFVRMALNALDGMLAQETNNKTSLGAVLNELCDVISDVALFSAILVLLKSVNELWWILLVLSVLTEFASLAVYQAVGVRPHSGPFGKSDRAVYLGLFAILLVAFPSAFSSTSVWLVIYILIGIVFSLFTIFNRIRYLNSSVE